MNAYLKKIITNFLIVSIVAAFLVVPTDGYAASEASERILEKFDDNSFSYSVDSLSTAETEVIKYSDNPNYGTVLSFKNGSSQKEYVYDIRRTASDSDAFAKDAWVTNGTYGRYSVTSFDIAPYNITARGMYVRLMNFKSDKSHVQLSFQKEKVYLYKLIDGTSTAVHIGNYTNKEMINVRIVMDMTDNVIIGVLLDGQNVFTEGETTSFLNPKYGDAYSQIEISYTNKTADEASSEIGCYFDNLHIVNYIDKDKALSGDGMNIFKYRVKNMKMDSSGDNIVIKDVELEKHTADNITCNVIAASYNGDALMHIGKKEEILVIGEDNTTFTLDYVIPKNSTETKIFVWGDELKPLCEPVAPKQIYENWTVTVNGNTVIPDVSLYKNYKGEIIVPVKNIVNHLGYDFIDNNDSTYTVDGFSHGTLTLTIGSENAYTDNAETIITSPYLHENVMVMAPLSVIEWAFGTEVTIDEETSTITITGEELDFWSTDWLTGIKISADDESQFTASYSISGIKNNATVEVYYKDAVYYADRIESVYYHRAVTPVKDENGVWHGGIGKLRQNHHYDILLKVTNNGSVTYYEKENAIKTAAVQEFTYEQFVGTDELKIVPTFENIGYYVNTVAETCSVEYRKVGDDEWDVAYAPYDDPYINGFRGSIVGLEPGTEYEIKVTTVTAEGTETEVVGQATTWAENPVVTKTIDVSEIYDGSGSLNITGYKGTPNGWIHITNNNDITIVGDFNCNEAVLINDCEYLIVDDLKVQGGYYHGILLTASSNNVRIRRADISGFGHIGLYNDNNGFYMLDGSYIDYNAGIYMAGSNGLVIENCNIYESLALTNPWDNGILSKKHPHGSAGIVYNQSRNSVIRNNNIIGSSEHMWNDGIESGSNTLYQGGAWRDTDIYGNTIENCYDDGIELDGGQMNIRLYNNTIDNAYKGISITPNMAGPTYIFNNLITNTFGGIKAGGGGTGTGMMTMGQTYLFGNTIFSDFNVIANNVIGTYGNNYHMIALNNIFISETGYAFYDSGNSDSISTENPGVYDRIENNIMVGNLGKGYSEADNIITEPTFTSDGNYNLSENSVGYQSAVWIDNFNESNMADIGAKR